MFENANHTEHKRKRQEGLSFHPALLGFLMKKYGVTNTIIVEYSNVAS